MERSQWYVGNGRAPFAIGDEVHWLLIARERYSDDPRLQSGSLLTLIDRIEQTHEFDIGEYHGNNGQLVAYGGQPAPPRTLPHAVLVEECSGRFLEAVNSAKLTSGRVRRIYELEGSFVPGASGGETVLETGTWLPVDRIDTTHAEANRARMVGWIVDLEVDK